MLIILAGQLVGAETSQSLTPFLLAYVNRNVAIVIEPSVIGAYP